MANGQRLTEKHYDGKGYFMRCSERCRKTSCDDCEELDKLVDRLGELEDKENRRKNTVEVVRCEECLYTSQYPNENGMYKCSGILTEDGDCFLMVKPEHFCAFGKRRGKSDDEKVKTHIARIVVSEGPKKPYYEILYYDPESGEYCIGYGSYSLENVCRWLSEDFEIVAAPAVETVELVYCKDCKHFENGGTCKVPLGAMSECGYFLVDEYDFCSYGERKDDEKE